MSGANPAPGGFGPPSQPPAAAGPRLRPSAVRPVLRLPVGRGKANRGEATNKGSATAGLICGIVATVILPLLGILLFASVMGGIGAAS